jgi:hypothetical protein
MRFIPYVESGHIVDYRYVYDNNTQNSINPGSTDSFRAPNPANGGSTRGFPGPGSTDPSRSRGLERVLDLGYVRDAARSEARLQHLSRHR